MPSRAPGRAIASVMRVEVTQALSPGGFGRAFDVLLRLLLSTALAVIGPSAFAAQVGDDSSAVQAKENDQSTPNTPSTVASVCDALATAAATNDLPVDVFTRLIWQESRFKIGR